MKAKNEKSVCCKMETTAANHQKCSTIRKARISTFKDYVGELTVIYRRTAKPTVDIRCAQDAYEWLYPYFDQIMDEHEEVKVIHLNRINQVVNLHHVSMGSDSGTVVCIKNIIRNALLIKTSGIILAHNHPSGNLRPSKPDIQTSLRLKVVAELLGLQLIDSIILTREGYYSLCENDDI